MLPLSPDHDACVKRLLPTDRLSLSLRSRVRRVGSMDQRQQLRIFDGELREVQTKMGLVERQIEQAEERALNATRAEDREFWRLKAMALWKEKGTLCDTQMMLRDRRAACVSGPGGKESMERITSSLDEAISVFLKGRESMDEAISVLSKGIFIALKPLTAQLRRTPSVAQCEGTSRTDGFKKQLVSLYCDAKGPMVEIYCNVTGLLLPSFEVIAGHIFPMRAHTLLNDFCPDLHSINDVTNGILWANVIEQAFELSLVSFEWDGVTHTLTPIVLDRNLMGMNLLQGVEYMRQLASGSDVGDEGQDFIQEESLRMSADEVNTLMQEIMDRVRSMNLKNSEKEEELRNQEYKRVFGPHINALYMSVLFRDLHMQPRQFPLHVNMSGRAFKVSSILAYQEAKRRGVLPVDFFFDPYSSVHYNPIDLYLSNEAMVSEVCAELCAASEDSSLDS